MTEASSSFWWFLLGDDRPPKEEQALGQPGQPGQPVASHDRLLLGFSDLVGLP